MAQQLAPTGPAVTRTGVDVSPTSTNFSGLVFKLQASGTWLFVDFAGLPCCCMGVPSSICRTLALKFLVLRAGVTHALAAPDLICQMSCQASN